MVGLRLPRRRRAGVITGNTTDAGMLRLAALTVAVAAAISSVRGIPHAEHGPAAPQLAPISIITGVPRPHPKCANCEHHQHHQHSPPPEPDAVASGPRTVPFLASAPTTGVTISGNPILLPPMEVCTRVPPSPPRPSPNLTAHSDQANVDYLLTSFDVDHLLLPFRVRAGKANNATGSRPQVSFVFAPV